VIPIAAVIAAATAAGFGAEHRLGEHRADEVAKRVVWLMLWVTGPPVVFVLIASLEVTAEVGGGGGARGPRGRAPVVLREHVASRAGCRPPPAR